MPAINLDTADAIELAELLAFLAAWLAADPGTLSPSLLAYVGHPAYGLDTLRCHLDRFAFLLGGNDGEHLFGEDQALPPMTRQGGATSGRHARPEPASGGANSGRPDGANRSRPNQAGIAASARLRRRAVSAVTRASCPR